MRSSHLEKKYLCRGENFNRYVRIGYCGDVNTLREWLEILFPGEEMCKRFEYTSPEVILEYILVHRGKRLEKIRD